MLSDDNHSFKCSDVKIKPYSPRWKVNKNYFYYNDCFEMPFLI